MSINIQQLSDKVKEMMAEFGYEITDKGYPTLEVLMSDDERLEMMPGLAAAYSPELHTIFARYGLGENEMYEMLMHELTHAYQDLSHITIENVCADPELDKYWEQEHERQAYAIGAYAVATKCHEMGFQSATGAVAWTKSLITTDRRNLIEDFCINTYRQLYISNKAA